MGVFVVSRYIPIGGPQPGTSKSKRFEGLKDQRYPNERLISKVIPFSRFLVLNNRSRWNSVGGNVYWDVVGPGLDVVVAGVGCRRHPALVENGDS
jgi:hypothetical protein